MVIIILLAGYNMGATTLHPQVYYYTSHHQATSCIQPIHPFTQQNLPSKPINMIYFANQIWVPISWCLAAPPNPLDTDRRNISNQNIDYTDRRIISKPLPYNYNNPNSLFAYAFYNSSTPQNSDFKSNDYSTFPQDPLPNPLPDHLQYKLFSTESLTSPTPTASVSPVKDRRPYNEVLKSKK